jgi:transcriptional regulator with XRE-family HTH domain
MKRRRNLIGPEVRKMRTIQNLAQKDLVARCGVLGWIVSRDMIAAIEGQARCVTDSEIVALAAALRIPVESLLPKREDALKLLRSVDQKI